MKYCPYCGADLIEDAVSFCAECGKQLPAGKPQKEKSKEKPEIKKIAKKKKKKPVKKLESSIEDETVVDDGYDGYYEATSLMVLIRNSSRRLQSLSESYSWSL